MYGQNVSDTHQEQQIDAISCRLCTQPATVSFDFIRVIGEALKYESGGSALEKAPGNADAVFLTEGNTPLVGFC